jgi:hypothetical protein
VETTILAMQARALLAVGIGWLAVGLWNGYDPLTVTWRAAVAATVAMWLTGKLLRIVAIAIGDKVSNEMAERETSAPSPTPAPAPAVAPSPAKRRT